MAVGYIKADTDVFLRALEAKGQIYALLTYPKESLTVVFAGQKLITETLYSGYSKAPIPECMRDWLTGTRAQMYTITGKGLMLHYGPLERRKIIFYTSHMIK
jgi:hypothetical protein